MCGGKSFAIVVGVCCFFFLISVQFAIFILFIYFWREVWVSYHIILECVHFSVCGKWPILVFKSFKSIDAQKIKSDLQGREPGIWDGTNFPVFSLAQVPHMCF